MGSREDRDGDYIEIDSIEEEERAMYEDEIAYYGRILPPRVSSHEDPNGPEFDRIPS